MAAVRDKGLDREKRPLSGFLLVDKPTGITSRKVVDIVRSCAGFDGKIGHSGTLDPMATGLLVLCLGKATRLASYLIRDDKSYCAVMEMGRETDSGDAEGEVVFRGDDQLEVIDDGDIHRAFDRYRGVFSQVPPRFSARKVGGRRAYELARSGISVELKASRVEIKELEITRIEKPEIHFFLKCSSGTYVRSLALDVGRELGTGAHLTSLRRLEVGPFSVEDAGELGALKKACGSREIGRWLFPSHTVLRKLQKVVVNADGERLLKQGSPVAQECYSSPGIDVSGPSSGAEVQVWNSSSDFFAVGRMGTEEGEETMLYPVKVLG